MYPDRYISPMSDQYGTYTIIPNTIDTQLSPLKPFASSSITFHTSVSARFLSAFGYSYPEITDWNQTASQLSSYVTGRVNALYSPSGANSKRRVRRNGRLHSSPGAQEGHQGKDNNTHREWSAAISVSKFDMQGQRFIVRLFCGAVPEKPGDWATSSSLLGSVVILPPPVAYNGADKPAHDEIVLLREESSDTHGGYADLEEDGHGEDTVEYLKKSLRWRVQYVSTSRMVILVLC
jgi:tyrosinase